MKDRLRDWAGGLLALGVAVATLLPGAPLLADDSEPPTLAHIEIRGDYPEAAEGPSLFGDIVESLARGLQRLDRASRDDSLAGVILHIDGAELGWAKLNEFHQAIKKLKAAGRPVYAYLDSATSADLLLASACDKIVMPEPGMVMLLGLRAEVSFYKNMLDFLRIQPEILRVGEFKSAGEPYTRSSMSPAYRLEMEELLDDLYKQITETIAAGRGMTAAEAAAIIDAGPYTAAAALTAKLIDHVAYEDGVPALMLGAEKGATAKIARNYGKKKVDADLSGLNGIVTLMNILSGVEPQTRRSSAPKIAVIHASGAINTGNSSSDFMGGQSLGSTTLIKAIRQARNDATVKAIVLRVDSPGGSALASDLIWHELEQVGKPFIASMGNVAASGGYYISMGADQIYADPGTITGSIGVVGGKVALQKFYELIGINTTVIQRGKNSGLLSTTTTFTDSERTAMQQMLNDIYGQFTTKAAAGRKMPVDALEKLARGRVYTGTRAKELGLIDQLGTLEDAIAAARTAAGLKPEEKVERLVLPKPVSPIEQLLGPLNGEVRGQVGGRAAAAAFADLIPAELRGLLQDITVMSRLEDEPALTVLPYHLKIR